ncbi:MAG: substrate-binding domain-containing protein [Atopobiaceae bacterium]|jgi:DNA-binding LacI/PurR family transcriptional regulator|nr:substrate-binding domain-containing protein [Atopobiaceae bacterium]
MATELLLDHGHGDVRFVAGPRDSVAGGLRQDGWRDALLRRGIEPLPPIRGDWTADSGYEAGIKIAADRGCTAVFAANDSMACGVMMALRDSGLRVPEDVSIVGVDDALVGLVPRVSLTTVRFRDEEVGMRAVQMALGKDPANAGGEIADVRVSADLVIRDTVADRR